MNTNDDTTLENTNATETNTGNEPESTTETIGNIIAGARYHTTPSVQDVAKNNDVARIVLERVEAECSKHTEIIGVMLCGSYPKGTWMPGLSDIDVFVKFDKDTPRDKFTEIAHNVGFSALEEHEPYVRYSEHPFVEAMVNNVKVNLVPCFDINDGLWQSAADRTPHHTEYMTRKLSEQMRDDIRVLKQFLKSNNLYGAEIAKRGFSGYITEVLVSYLGSFEGVIRKFARAEIGMVLGNAGRQFDADIVVMDPIDNQRNLTAAVSTENMGRFIMLCRKFLDEPSLSLFRTASVKPALSIVNNCLMVTFRYRKRSRDVIWGQAKKSATSIASKLKHNGFKTVKSGAFADDNGQAILFFLLESDRISKYHMRVGPSFFNEAGIKAFKSKNAGHSEMLWINTTGHICSFEQRRENDATQFLTRLLTTGISASGIPKAVIEDIGDAFSIRNGGRVLDKDLLPAMYEFLSESL